MPPQGPSPASKRQGRDNLQSLVAPQVPSSYLQKTLDASQMVPCITWIEDQTSNIFTEARDDPRSLTTTCHLLPDTFFPPSLPVSTLRGTLIQPWMKRISKNV